MNEADWGSMSKRQFKRAELDHELGHEEQYNNYLVKIDGKPWKVFPTKSAANKAASTIQSKYGKKTEVYTTTKPVSETTTAGAVASSMGGGNGFLNGGPGTLSRTGTTKKRKKRRT